MYSLLEEVWNDNNELKNITEKFKNYNLEKYNNLNIENNKINTLEKFSSNIYFDNKNLNNNLNNSKDLNKNLNNNLINITCDDAINKILNCNNCRDKIIKKLNQNNYLNFDKILNNNLNFDKILNIKLDDNSKEFILTILFGLLIILILDLLIKVVN